jgi:hypothetical protein
MLSPSAVEKGSKSITVPSKMTDKKPAEIERVGVKNFRDKNFATRAILKLFTAEKQEDLPTKYPKDTKGFAILFFSYPSYASWANKNLHFFPLSERMETCRKIQMRF